MNILFCEEPTCLIDKFVPTVNNFNIFFKCYCYDNFKVDKKDKVEIKSLVPESTYYQNQSLHIIDDLNLIPIENKDIRNIFSDLDFLSISKKMLSNTLNSDQKNLLKKLYLTKLNNYQPDIIFCFNHMNKIFNELYPKALVLSVESGIFSRVPFMSTLFYDPCGISQFSFLNKYKKEIQKFEISKEQNDTINNFKQELVSIIDQNNPFSEQIQEYVSKFRYNVLVPLQFLGIPNVEVETDFKSFFEYMSYIMDNIP